MSTRNKVWVISVIAGLVGGQALAQDPRAHSLNDQISEARKSVTDDDLGPSISIARRVVDAAGFLERYVRESTAIRPEFDGAASVSAAVMASAAYEPQKLEEGAVAYAALVALQEPAFVSALSDQSPEPAERAAFAQRLVQQPDLVMEVPGADRAAAKAAAALNRLGAGLVDRGRSLKKAAFDVQRQSWSSEPVTEPAERLARVKARGQTNLGLSETETQTLLSHVVATREAADGSSSSAAPSSTALRGLALAAVAMAGQAEEDRADALSPLLSDAATGACLRRAKLNLHQCLAAAGPQFEDVYCAGVHAMTETGQCLVTASGAKSGGGVKVPIASALRNRSVAVPIASASPAASPSPAARVD